ncbi:MAG: Asp-tRNA(Asn)/Glu-tRNA(Gln) amidotransferase subunit GatC [Candidatus Zambryskibacteria bacterium]|nr:Asp-tRNA(Asn)/Glu-tRNA(Gln) amidotransferase subunit GatC [Candidatus Zambryskibacteria bacterium]
MSISKEDIKKLADLARIEMTEKEIEKLSTEIDDILDYIGQISHFTKASRDEFDENQIRNVMREDESDPEKPDSREELIGEFPEREGDYLKVKKIL